MDDGSNLNDAERKVRDIFKARLGAQVMIAQVKQAVDRIAVHVVAPHDFDWAQTVALPDAGGRAAAATGCNIDVDLTTWFPPPKA
jgi:hypothetical protein